MYIRITGGAIWTHPDDDFEPIFFDGTSWLYRHERFRGVRIEGRCRIVFGISASPHGVSEILESVSLIGPTLHASGIPFAIYDPVSETWRGIAKAIWWQAFRIESANLRDAEQHACRKLPPRQFTVATGIVTTEPPANEADALAAAR